MTSGPGTKKRGELVDPSLMVGIYTSEVTKGADTRRLGDEWEAWFVKNLFPKSRGILPKMVLLAGETVGQDPRGSGPVSHGIKTKN